MAMYRSTATFVRPLAALLALATFAPLADAADSDAELRQKLKNYVRTRDDKAAALVEATGEQKKAELVVKAAQVRYDDATKLIAQLTAEAADARRAVADAGRTAQEAEKAMRDQVDQSPDVAETAERFRRIDGALQRIAETIAAPVRTGDAWRAAEQKLATLREKRELYAKSDAVDPSEMAALLAQEQSVEFDMNQLMHEALNASGEYREAKAMADAASKELAALRDKHAARIADDPAVKAARDASAAAKDLLAEKTKQLAEARETQADARTEGRRASAVYANATQRATALDTEIKQLDAAIAQLRRQIND